MRLSKSKKVILIITVYLPLVLFALFCTDIISIGVAFFIEALDFITISIFVFKPLSEMFTRKKSKELFWTLFIIIIVILLFFDIKNPSVALGDFLALLIGSLIIVPISEKLSEPKKNSSNPICNNSVNNNVINVSQQSQISVAELRCAKCNSILNITDKFCSNCGEPIINKKVQPQKITVSPFNFDEMYSLTEDRMLEEAIKRELIKAGIDKSSNLIPINFLRRKTILNLVFIVLMFVFITLIFFHFPIYTYIIGANLLFVFYKLIRNFNLIKYLKKEIKARPQEKITNIVMNVKNTFVRDKTKVFFAITLIIALIVPLIIFSSPRILYEKTDGGYAVRYYTFGLTNFKSATIPETYKNEKVVSLRGNTFSNMPFLESVQLPNSIVEIRGQAFKNCERLVTVNIPTNLEYLGGGAFYGAKSIKSIELPDTLTFLGGEAFYKASSLESVKLSKNLSEIRGNTFEYCTSLKSITIPDNVTRIGAHAFYGASSLSEVEITKNSKLAEIGSSAFRECTSLYTIVIPKNTYYNEKAFKDSPTTVYRYK